MNSLQVINHNTVIVDEKVTLRSNHYNLLDEEGRSLGQIIERRRFWHYLLKRYFSPFTLSLVDLDNHTVAQLHKGWSFLAPSYRIIDNNDKLIAFIKSRVTLLKSKADMFLPNGQLLATMEGNWKAWNFSITASDGKVLANIDKKFNGVMKELFTTADKYVVSINPEISDCDVRVAILFVACAIDMILKED